MSVPDLPDSELPEKDGAQPEQGIALTLSGGGFRAMLFHTGSLWRLNDAGLLSKVARISSVSGGSLAAAFLGLKWKDLGLDRAARADDFSLFVAPLRSFASRTIDIPAVLTGLLSFSSISDRVVAAYRRHLFGKASLQDLPDEPRFVINATNVQSGALWRFEKPYMRDYRVGEIRTPPTELARAVAASSAFPPFLSPARFRFKASDYSPPSGTEDLLGLGYKEHVYLSDGGVYDNLGLEAAVKRYATVLVSDGGAKMRAQLHPSRNWLCHLRRVLDVIDNQVRSLRSRQLIDSFKGGERKGAYWGIRTNIAEYGLLTVLPCPQESTRRLAEIPTRLAKLSAVHQERLINWGFAVCDAALRTHFDPMLPLPPDFPYPKTGVG